MERELKRPSRLQDHTKAVVILHGRSELLVAKHIKQNLRLPIELYSRDKGYQNIQITSLITILTNTIFKTICCFLKTYDKISSNGRGSNKQLNDFRLFTIMDTDDCSKKQKQDYIDKTMFKGKWFYDYICPVYNSQSLDCIMEEIGYAKKGEIEKTGKTKWYETIFPNKVGYTKQDIEAFRDKLKKCKNTNMDEFVSYCLEYTKDFSKRQQ